MLVKALDASEYIAEFKKRFTNFCEKSPILLSYAVTNNQVQVVIEETDDVLTFDFQFSVDVKEFIYGIRQILIRKAYPVIEKTEFSERTLSAEEQITMAQQGTPVDAIPSVVTEQKAIRYLIDRVIIYKDTFILRDLETDKLYRYKLNGSSVFFLKKMRLKKMSPKEAGDFFFSKAELLNEILPADA